MKIRQNKGLNLLVLWLVLLAGCAEIGSENIIINATGPIKKKRINAPAKPGPVNPDHPTQRPYRINGRTYYPLPNAEGFSQTGIASWYGKPFHGRKTSNGETYDMNSLTCAHKTLPMGTWLLVENLANHREVTVRVNDRGPFVRGRIIDMSRAGAGKLGYRNQGTARVKITALGEAVPGRSGTRPQFKRHQDFQRGDFYVQIGSFSSMANAGRLQRRLSSWGRKSVIREFNRGDRIFYRVQVKAGNELTEARHVEKVMNKAGFPGAFVVAR